MLTRPGPRVGVGTEGISRYKSSALCSPEGSSEAVVAPFIFAIALEVDILGLLITDEESEAYPVYVICCRSQSYSVADTCNPKAKLTSLNAARLGVSIVGD